MYVLKPYRWWLVLLLVLGWVGAVIWRWETYPNGVNLVSYCKIRKGMTYEEVMALTGQPCSNRSVWDSDRSGWAGGDLDLAIGSFNRRGELIMVHLDGTTKKVVLKDFSPADGPRSGVEKFIANHWPF